MKKLAVLLICIYLTATVVPVIAEAAPGQNGGSTQLQQHNQPPQQKPDEKKPAPKPGDNKQPPQQQKPGNNKPGHNSPPQHQKPGDNKPKHGKYQQCNVKHCGQTGDHKHNNNWYSGHFVGDGHNWHKPCNLKNCHRNDVHKHNNTWYFGGNFHK